MRASVKTRNSRNLRILYGWKEIAGFLDAGVRTVQRYEKHLGLPVRRPAGKCKGAVIATVAELEGWVAAKPLAQTLRLQNLAQASSSWAGLQDGMAKMKGLCDEMRQLRQEIKSSITTLRSSIHVVGPESKTQPEYIEEQDNDFVGSSGRRKDYLDNGRKPN